MSELTLYSPTALQFPSEGHDTELRRTSWPVVVASAGSAASTPAPQAPAVSVSKRPWRLPESSVYEPTALQLPGDEQETESMESPRVWS